MIRGHVKSKYRKVTSGPHWELRMIGENLNNRIDWLKEDGQ